MSKDGEKATVFRTTKVRTKLRGDNSWLQRASQSQDEAEAEKPWIAEVRASRLNGANVETSPASSPSQSPAPTKTSPERSPASGFMIRGVFTKTEKPPASSNGYSGTTHFTKKPSETYKKIAPHIVRNTESQEGQLSPEEQEKRTEAASHVLKKPAKQRSYVLSAAKLYESKEKTPDLLVNSNTSFVAQRVEVADDEESNTSPASPTTTETIVAPLPKPRILPRTNSTLTETKEETKPEEVKVEEKVPEDDPFENMVPGCTKVATPLPELAPDLVQAIYVKGDDSVGAEQPESPAAEPAPETPAPATPHSALTVEAIVIVTEEAVNEEPELAPEPNLVHIVQEEISSDSTPVCRPDTTPERIIEVEPLQPVELEPEQVPAQTESTLITLEDEELEQPQEEQKEAVEDEPTTNLVEIEHIETSAEQEPIHPVSNAEPQTDDLLGFNDSGPRSLQAAPSGPELKSQDLLTPVESEKPEPESANNNVDLLSNANEIVITEVQSETPEPESPSNIVDLLSNEIVITEVQSEKPEPKSANNIVDLLSNEIVITEVQSEKPEPESPSNIVDLLSNEIVITEVQSLSTPPDLEEERPTAPEAQSGLETVTLTTQTEIITVENEAESADPLSSYVITTVSESSSTDPFDPYPIGTTSPNSSSDLLQPLQDTSNNSEQSRFVETQDPGPVTHLNTQRSWARTWETDWTESTEKSQVAAAAEAAEAAGAGGGQDGDQQKVIVFLPKSNENDSPWDRWTLPTVCALDNKDDGEEEPAEQKKTETEVITSVTTITETFSEPVPSMDHLSMESEAESKKPFVYVKEYVDTTELSLHNARVTDRFDDLTSTSSSYSYSSPSTYLSGSSKCTFCGEQVGDDAKITIEHLNINCHPECFKCGVCSKPMGDLLHKMFLHGGKVHCETCYRNALD